MKAQSIALALVASGLLQSVPLTAVATGSCELQTLDTTTEFPIRSQLRGQRGIVVIQVSVDSQGRVTQTQLVQSSGHRLLDRAAVTSIRKHWLFDITGCEPSTLPATRTVAVDYRNDYFGTP